MQCLDDTGLARFVEGGLSAEDAEAAEAHLGTCDSCRALFGQLLASGPANRGSAPAVPEGAMIDRYVIERELGFGAMGRVYLAIDPELDRKVAIKVLRPARAKPEPPYHGAAGTGPAVRPAVAADADRDLRLRREAQALAKVTHPNVATVYDVGEVAGTLFLAMEYVAGGTVAEWLRGRIRPWRDVVRVFAAAGRGLAAVHARGLVHRDFKPENVLLDETGAPKVTDFGLVATLRDELTGSDLGAAEGMDVFGSLTRTGAVVGTPAYMAPEQFGGGIVDARSDQFSLCVALYEALFHSRPFPGGTVAELRASLREPAREPSAAARRGVPRWLTAAVMRGLALDPPARWGSVDELVRALSIERRVARRRAIAAAAAVVVLGGGGAIAWYATRTDPAAACAAAAHDIDRVWGPAQKAALSTAIGEVKAPFATDAARGVVGALDAYAGTWRASHVAACAATHARGTQTAAALDLRIACLARRERALATTIEVLSAPTPALVEHAVDVAAALPPIAECDDPAALSGVAPPPADAAVRKEIETVRAQLARADAWTEAGSLELARPLIDLQVAAATRLRYAPLEAEALLTRAALDDAARDFTAAAASYRAAAANADRGRDDHTRCWALVKLVQTLAVSAKLDAAEAEIPAAEAALERVGSDDELAELWDATHATVDYLRGRMADAQARYDAAIARARKRGDQHAVGTLLQLEVVALGEVSDPGPMIALAEEAVTIAKAEYGDRHPETARREATVARVLALSGQLDAALARAQHAYAALVAVYGENHVDAATTELTIGNLLKSENKLDDARARLEHAYTSLEAALGKEHFKLADVLLSLAQVERRAGKPDAALADLDRARTMLETTLGPDTDGLIAIYHTIGEVDLDLGKSAAAEAAFTAGLALGEKIAPDNPRLAMFTSELGNLRLAAKDPEGAVAYLERALATYTKADGDPEVLAYIRLDLAHAKLALGARTEALALARAARPALSDPADIKEADALISRTSR